MSYDILVFEPRTVTDAEFSSWWAHQSEWPEDHRYDDVVVTTPALRRFACELMRQFPPLNGPNAPTDEQIDSDPDLSSRLTDYTFGSTLVYLCFRWGQASQAQEACLRIARPHGVAVALVSDDGRIIRA